jgi:hypothetical protein
MLTLILPLVFEAMTEQSSENRYNEKIDFMGNLQTHCSIMLKKICNENTKYPLFTLLII